MQSPSGVGVQIDSPVGLSAVTDVSDNDFSNGERVRVDEDAVDEEEARRSIWFVVSSLDQLSTITTESKKEVLYDVYPVRLGP